MAIARAAGAGESDAFTIETWRQFCAAHAARDAGKCLAKLIGDTIPFEAKINYDEPNESPVDDVARDHDSGGFRPYIQIRVGQAVIVDPSSAEDVTLESPSGEPVLGISLGVDVNDYLGVELAVDNFETDLNSPLADLKAGEYSVWTFLVQARLRAANWRRMLTPYLLVGAGAAYGEFNDRNVLLAASLPGAPEVSPVIGGSDLSFAGSVGAGVEYFVAHNIALGIEAKYLYLVETDIATTGGDQTLELDSFYFSAAARLYLDEDGASGRPAADSDDTRAYVAVRAGGAFFTQPDASNGVSIEGQGSQVGSAAVGVNLNKHVGIELASEYSEPQIVIEGTGPVAEYSLWTLLGQVRLRFPIWADRLVPYAVFGGGVGFGQINDRIIPAGSTGLTGDTHHTTFVAAVGAGIDYFLAENLALNAEFKYITLFPADIAVNGRPADLKLDPVFVSAGLRVLF